MDRRPRLGVAIAGGVPAALVSAGWLHVDESSANLVQALERTAPLLPMRFEPKAMLCARRSARRAGRVQKAGALVGAAVACR
ncbi:hypothetical protein [Micromonospora citrea]|uniref:hypothetical protein n=1 Tax=Micromonospora citrea TaxID=47855 RepID=UPI000ACCA4E1|nr:hypothetical protein [Micromonospora citrea]